jgi:hypothetical protein
MAHGSTGVFRLSAVALLSLFVSLADAPVAQATMPGTADGHAPSATPPVYDIASVRITLRRSLCFGTCPYYSVEIRGTGDVLYEGSDCVAVRGERSDKIDVDRVRRLVSAFERADFFSLRESYRSRITDIPTFRISLSVDGREKSVEDYGGTMVGMPAAVRALEDEVDETASTDRWVYGDSRSCHGQTVGDSARKRG